MLLDRILSLSWMEFKWMMISCPVSTPMILKVLLYLRMLLLPLSMERVLPMGWFSLQPSVVSTTSQRVFPSAIKSGSMPSPVPAVSSLMGWCLLGNIWTSGLSVILQRFALLLDWPIPMLLLRRFYPIIPITLVGIRFSSVILYPLHVQMFLYLEELRIWRITSPWDISSKRDLPLLLWTITAITSIQV